MIRTAVAFFSLALFALLAADLLAAGPLTRLDPEAVRFVAAHRTPWLTDAMLLLANVHETRSVLVATALIAAWLLARRHGARVALLAAIPTGMGLNWLLKQAFQRPRPGLEALVHLDTYSFPSGHAVASTLFYGSLCALFLQRRPGRIAGVAGMAAAGVMVVLVCFGRVYLGAHHPSDVLAGASVGGAWLAAWVAVLARRDRW